MSRAGSIVAAAIALVGALAIYADDRAAGAPIPIVGIGLLLSGLVVFAVLRFVAREEPRGRLGEARVTVIPTASRDGRLLRAAWLVALVTVVLYATLGYSPFVLAGWLASLLLGGESFRPARARRVEVLGFDGLLFLVPTMIGLGFLVLPYLDAMPIEISTDEIYSIQMVRDIREGRFGDLVGLATWWGLPAFQFTALAAFGAVFGTSLEAMRLASALVAIAITVPFYVWVRTVTNPKIAMMATTLLAFSHAFVGWGRIGLTQNAPVLLLVTALALLALGVKHRCPWRVFWGGVALGLGFHTYPSGQIAIVIWLVAVVAGLVTRSVSRRGAASLLALSLCGFVLAVGPMFVLMIGSWDAFTARAAAVSMTNEATVASLAQTLELSSPAEAVRENSIRALLAFNGAYPYVTYPNPGHAFLDPFTGTLLWLGLAIAVLGYRRFWLSTAALGILAVYATGFLTEGAPVHGRLLMALPFAALLAALALSDLARLILPGALSGRARRRLAGAILVGIVVANIAIMRSHVRWQRALGLNDAVTAVGRSLDHGIRATNPVGRLLGQEPQWDPRQLVVIVTNEEHPVFFWADETEWAIWTAFFSDESRVHLLDDPEEFAASPRGMFGNSFWRTATVYMRTEVWDQIGPRLREHFPDLTRELATTNRRITAVRVTN